MLQPEASRELISQSKAAELITIERMMVVCAFHKNDDYNLSELYRSADYSNKVMTIIKNYAKN